MTQLRRVLMRPAQFRNAVGGVLVHVAALERHLPEFGWQVVREGEPYDVVHCHALEQHVDMSVYTSHGIYPVHGKMPPWHRDANAVLLENIRLAKTVIAVSRWTAAQWTDKTHVIPYIIPNGVDVDVWRNVPQGVWRSKLGLGVTSTIVLWGKTGFSDVLDPTPAIELAIRNPKITVVMPVDSRLLPNAPKNVRLVGQQPFRSMQQLLVDCDVYLATTCENHSIQVLEALALGKPVLGYAWGGTLETLGSTHGVLVPPRDLDSLEVGLSVALDRVVEFAEKGPALVSERYQWRDVVRLVAEVYELAVQAQEKKVVGPKCSIVIPCYNKVGYVGQAIRSAISQRDAPPYEVIVVDDGSTDGSLKEIRAVVGGDAGVKVISQENTGVSVARNNGIRASDGRYITCLDADDELDPLFLSRLSAALDADPGLGIAYSDMVVHGHNDEERPIATTLVRCDEYSFENLRVRNFMPCCNMFRREVWERTGGYNPVIDLYGPSWEDYELWLHAGELGWYGKRVPGGLFKYRKVAKTGRAYDSRTREAALRGIVNRLHRNLYVPLVSFVIPCYRQAKFLGDAIDSVFGQTFPDFEVVVVDDGNVPSETEEIASVVGRYNSDDVRLIHLETNRGLATARNMGFRESHGQWVVPLDADDKIDKTWLEKCLSAVRLDPNNFAYTDSILWWPDESREKMLESHEYDFNELLTRVTWPCTILVSRRAWEQAGGYKPQMSTAGGWEDWEFAVAIGENGVCGTRVPEPLFYYRQHSPEQMRHTAEKNKTLLQETMRRLHAETYRGERSMACCGGRSERVQPPPAGSAQVVTRRVSGEVVDGIMIRYVGQAVGTSTWTAPSGAQYRFGLSDPLQKVVPRDLEFFRTQPQFFQVVTP